MKNNIFDKTKSQRLLKLPEVIEITRMPRSSIYFNIHNDKFPKPINMGLRSVCWIEGEIYKYIQRKINERNMSLVTPVVDKLPTDGDKLSPSDI